jgi:metallo-beta-lactamase class B
MRRLLFALLLANSVFAQSDPTSRSWNQPIEPFRIAGNIYYVGASDITSYLITTPAGHILLDGGFVETAPIILANIKKLGFRIEDVRILLASHAHYDHAGGLAELKRLSGAKFHASRGDLPLFARGGLDDPQFGNRFPFPPVHADRVVEDGSKVTLGGTTMTARITPGHTPGCTTWTMRVREKGKMLDVVFVGSPSIPNSYRLKGNPRYPNAIADYRKQYDILLSLRPDVFLASHGNFFELEEKRKGEKSFIDPEGYVRVIKRFEEDFKKRVGE